MFWLISRSTCRSYRKQPVSILNQGVCVGYSRVLMFGEIWIAYILIVVLVSFHQDIRNV